MSDLLAGIETKVENYDEISPPEAARLLDEIKRLRSELAGMARPRDTAARVTACPECGSALEPSWENDAEYQTVCRPCGRLYGFSAGMFGNAPNVLRWSRPARG